MASAATQRSAARKTKSVGFVFACSVRRGTLATRPHGSGSKSVRRDVAAFMTLTQLRRSTQLQVNPVRLCVRRGAVGLGEAQASPLFRDNAPREVHLWQ
jgi:hypothetical protein